MTRSWLSLLIYARHIPAVLRQDRDSRQRCLQQQQQQQQQQVHNGYSPFNLMPIIYAYTNEMLLQVIEYSNRTNFKRRLMWANMFNPVVKAEGIKENDDEAQAKADKKAREKARTSHHRNSFRQRTIRSYENRLRRYSSPDKIFRYFATIKMKNEHGRWEIYMTPLDFLRSLMPGFLQPENLGLDRYRKIDLTKPMTYPGLSEDSIFCKFHSNGLLTYADYLFLVCLISMPERYIEMAFRLFDFNGDGNLNREELNGMFERFGFGESYLKNMKVDRYFFGQNLNQKISISEFLQFQRLLNRDILMMEFNMLMKNPPPMSKDIKERRKQEKNMKITEFAFAKVLLAYAGFPSSVRMKTLNRIKQRYSESTRGISLDDFMAFFAFVRDISAIDAALTFHYFAGADISRETLKHISKVVVGVQLSDHLIDIVYTVFDTDENGILSRKDLVNAFHERKTRGRDVNNQSIGFSDKFCVIGKCFQETIRSYI